MTRDRMDNTGFEGGEAVLLAARGLPRRDVVTGGRRTAAGALETVALEMGVADGGGGRPTDGGPLAQTNGSPVCHCSSTAAEDKSADYREDSKTPSLPAPVVAHQNPWHRHKTIYLSVTVVTLAVWIVAYTVVSQMDLV